MIYVYTEKRKRETFFLILPYSASEESARKIMPFAVSLAVARPTYYSHSKLELGSLELL